MTDQELLQRFVEEKGPNREMAFRDIVERHAGWIQAAARRHVGNAAMADDVTQAVFFVLARKARNLSRNVQLPAWLHGVTRNVCRDARKTTVRQQIHELKAATMKSMIASEEISETAASLTPHLDAALATLAPTDRSAIILRYMQSRSVTEVAADLGVSGEAAQKRIERALHKLRASFGKMGVALSPAALPAAMAAHGGSALPATVADAITRGALIGKQAPATALLAKSALRRLFWTPAKVLGAAAALALLGTAALVAPERHQRPPILMASAPATAPMAPATEPLDPSLLATPAQRQQTLEALYTLRYSTVFVNPDETYQAVRALADIGKPVVPEICRELDRTTNDSARRSLAMVLRIIGDQRAVPALIRALRLTRVMSSDCGDTVADRQLWQFLNDHRLRGERAWSYPNIDINRSDREILAALKAMTDQAVPSAAYFRDEAIRDAAADDWQQWWDEQGKKSLAGTELPLAAPADAGDPVEQAGTARYGVLFPTGPAVHLSTVKEVLLPPQGDWDSRAYIHLATGQTYSLLEGASDPAANVENYSPWFRERAIDAMATTYIKNAVPIPGTNGMTAQHPIYTQALDGSNLRTWIVDNAEWDHIDADIAAGKPFALPPHGLDNDFNCRDLETGDLLPRTYPMTFLILTSGHSRGILQILGNSDQPPGVKFRYRLFEGLGNDDVPGGKLAPVPQAAFGPENSAVLHSPLSGQPSALSLVTGATWNAPANLVHDREGTPGQHYVDGHAWLADVGADLVVQPLNGDEEKLFAVQTGDMAVFPCSKEAWEKLSAGDAIAISQRRAPSASDFMTQTDRPDARGSFVFKTRNGTVGIARVLDGTPDTLQISYKLVK
jgi:RNA polymerase sigma factor (sigma-70 family)